MAHELDCWTFWENLFVLFLGSIMRNIIQNYSEISSIQGVVYIFQNQQTLVGRLFWIAVIVLMLTLGQLNIIDKDTI